MSTPAVAATATITVTVSSALSFVGHACETAKTHSGEKGNDVDRHIHDVLRDDRLDEKTRGDDNRDPELCSPCSRPTSMWRGSVRNLRHLDLLSHPFSPS